MKIKNLFAWRFSDTKFPVYYGGKKGEVMYLDKHGEKHKFKGRYFGSIIDKYSIAVNSCQSSINTIKQKAIKALNVLSCVKEADEVFSDETLALIKAKAPLQEADDSPLARLLAGKPGELMHIALTKEPGLASAIENTLAPPFLNAEHITINQIIQYSLLGNEEGS